jgi:hypothetical protein
MERMSWRYFTAFIEINEYGLHISNQFEELIDSAGLPGFQKLYLLNYLRGQTCL